MAYPRAYCIFQCGKTLEDIIATTDDNQPRRTRKPGDIDDDIETSGTNNGITTTTATATTTTKLPQIQIKLRESSKKYFTFIDLLDLLGVTYTVASRGNRRL